jgi:hypothetical protein
VGKEWGTAREKGPYILAKEYLSHSSSPEILMCLSAQPGIPGSEEPSKNSAPQAMILRVKRESRERGTTLLVLLCP